MKTILEQNDTDLNFLLIQGFKNLEEAPKDPFPLGQTKHYEVQRIRNDRTVNVELVKLLSEPLIFQKKVGLFSFHTISMEKNVTYLFINLQKDMASMTVRIFI